MSAKLFFFLPLSEATLHSNPLAGGALQHTALDPPLVDAPAAFHDHVPAEAEALVDPSAVHRGDSGLAVVGATPERDGAQVRLRVSGGVEDREGTPHVTGSGGRLFAGIYSTILRTSLVTSTTATDFFTCYSCTNALLVVREV